MVLKGKIVKILDQYRVIINLGYKSGIKKDMIFIIYSEGEEIKDPDTDEVLGKIEYLKGKIKPIHIQDNFSIMETAEKEASVGFSGIIDLLASSKITYVRKPLQIENKELKENNVEKLIRIGDLVREDISS